MHMPSIKKYKNLIKLVPVYKQSTRIRREVWARFSYSDKERIENRIFGDKAEVEISREDLIKENDPAKKIVMTLMWGYPTGGRGSNIENILKQLDNLSKLLSGVNKKNLKKEESNILIKKFQGIPGLGISTWSKLLYFFMVQIESMKCQIYDLKIVESLNKKQFSELGAQIWRQDVDHYYQYVELVNNLAKCMCVCPEQVELFLFYFNHSYKF